MSKNKIQLVIDSLETDESLMRFDKVSQAVALLKETHGEMSSGVSTGPVPNVSEIREELTRAVTDFNNAVLALRERYPELREYIGA